MHEWLEEAWLNTTACSPGAFIRHDNKMVKSPYNCSIFVLTHPQVANHHKNWKWNSKKKSQNNTQETSFWCKYFLTLLHTLTETVPMYICLCLYCIYSLFWGTLKKCPKLDCGTPLCLNNILIYGSVDLFLTVFVALRTIIFKTNIFYFYPIQNIINLEWFKNQFHLLTCFFLILMLY